MNNVKTFDIPYVVSSFLVKTAPEIWNPDFVLLPC